MKRLLKLLALVSMMGLIYFFSSQPSNDSTVTTNGVIEFIYKIYDFIVAGKGYDYDTFWFYYFKPIRKLAHFSEFGLLGLLSYINVKEYFKNNHVLYSLLISVIYAISDEIHQIFVAGRYCSFVDVLIDASGALCAILLIHFLSKKCLKR